MEINIFKSKVVLIQSTSPVPGKLAATAIDPKKRIWADLFLWDPMSGVVQFDGDTLYQLLVQERRKQSPWIAGALWVTEGAISVVKAIKRLTGGSYGGSLGYGEFGRMAGLASAVMAIVFAILAAVVLAPLTLIAWVLRKLIDQDMSSETQQVVDQVGTFFAADCLDQG